MKFLPAAALCCLPALLLAGCESSIGDSVQTALSPREAPRTRVFQAEGRATYEAAKAAAEEMGYHYVRGGPAEGELDELSEITGGEDAGGSRQLSLKVRMSPADPSGTSVEVSFVEILETNQNGATPGMATEAPLKDTPLYEVFFRTLGNDLQAPPKG
jgi:hypothetical protein